MGKYPCVLKSGSEAERCYGVREISERHRHRYEFSNDFRQLLTESGLNIAGTSPNDHLVEIVELPIIPGLWVCSSILNSRAARTGHIRFSGALSRRR